MNKKLKPVQRHDKAAKQSFGLGDMISKITEALGIPECRACKERKERFNRFRLR